MNKTQMKAIIAVVIWGAGFVFTKYALSYFTPVFVVFVRFAIGLVILGFTVISRNEFKFPNYRELPYLIITGFIGVTFHQWLQATGLVTASATTSAWIVSIIPVFTFILGLIFLRERGTPINWLGIILSFMGIIWVISQGRPISSFSKTFVTYGDILIFISAINWAVFSILSRRGLKKYPPALMMFYIMFFGLVFSGLWLLTSQNGFLSSGNGNVLEAIVSLLALGLFGSGLAYIFWYDALKVLPAYQLSIFIYLEPIVTMILAAALIREPITGSTIFGGAITILGIILVNKRPILLKEQQTSA